MKYQEFRPTGFDPRGLGLPDRQDWRVLEVLCTRDSSLLDESNFEVACAILGEESEDSYEVHRFGHWGPGWYEIIISNPENAQAMAAADGIERALADYPVLDDQDYSRRTWEAVQETWARASIKDRLYYLSRSGGGCSMFAARRDEVPETNHGLEHAMGVE